MLMHYVKTFFDRIQLHASFKCSVNAFSGTLGLQMLEVLQHQTAKMVLLHHTIMDLKRANESCTLYGKILIHGLVIKSELQAGAGKILSKTFLFSLLLPVALSVTQTLHISDFLTGDVSKTVNVFTAKYEVAFISMNLILQVLLFLPSL